jgi:tRNA (adenine-N(1)-)-methyltransferase non-catalytic subunit
MSDYSNEMKDPTSGAAAAHDPLLIRSQRSSSGVVREGDYVMLQFGDNRQFFAHCVQNPSGQHAHNPKKPAVALRIHKRTYPTYNLVGLPYGTILEQGPSRLVVLPSSEKLLPGFDFNINDTEKEAEDTDDTDTNENNTTIKDNRCFIDNNTAQTLDQNKLAELRASLSGAEIVGQLVANSSTFDQKNIFSKEKYIVRKQLKYQPRCRLVRCTAATICDAMYVKDPRRIMNLRSDSLAQILSYANLSAGCQTILWETCMGIVTGAVAHRMGGYGRILSFYSGQQPSFTDTLSKFNLTFAENFSIKWIHSGDIFHNKNDEEKTNGKKEGDTVANDTTTIQKDDADQDDVEDPDKAEREELEWPCVLQDHTRNYIQTDLTDPKRRKNFLLKRQARFCRKLCRPSPLEAAEYLKAKQSDSLILVTKYDPTETLLALLPFLAPSCPFVVFCEFMEPLTECFRELQRQDLAINLRLSDTWTREFQILPGRTHPSMNMSQHGGFILTGIKIHPETGRGNNLDEELLKEIRASMGGRRGRKRQQKLKKKEGNNRDGMQQSSKRHRVTEASTNN